VFCIYLRTNSDLCHLQHKLIGFYNRDEKCLQRGKNWVFKKSNLRFVLGLIILWKKFHVIHPVYSKLSFIKKIHRRFSCNSSVIRVTSSGGVEGWQLAVESTFDIRQRQEVSSSSRCPHLLSARVTFLAQGYQVLCCTGSSSLTVNITTCLCLVPYLKIN